MTKPAGPTPSPRSVFWRLTGTRRSEVLNLRWRNIGKDALRLEDSKTGPRSVPHGKAAQAVIDVLPGPRDPDAFLFPRFAGITDPHRFLTCWQAVRKHAALGCSGIGGTGPRRDMRTLMTST